MVAEGGIGEVNFAISIEPPSPRTRRRSGDCRWKVDWHYRRIEREQIAKSQALK